MNSPASHRSLHSINSLANASSTASIVAAAFLGDRVELFRCSKHAIRANSSHGCRERPDCGTASCVWAGRTAAVTESAVLLVEGVPTPVDLCVGTVAIDSVCSGYRRPCGVANGRAPRASEHRYRIQLLRCEVWSHTQQRSLFQQFHSAAPVVADQAPNRSRERSALTGNA